MASQLDWLTGQHSGELTVIRGIATKVGLDQRGLESGLVRLAPAHRRVAECPGGERGNPLDLSSQEGSGPTDQRWREPKFPESPYVGAIADLLTTR